MKEKEVRTMVDEQTHRQMLALVAIDKEVKSLKDWARKAFEEKIQRDRHKLRELIK